MAKKSKVVKKAGQRTTKTNVAISIAPELIDQLREVAGIENCSVSALVQRCVEEYLPVIRSSPTQGNVYRLEELMGRLTAAVTTADMRKSGVRPFSIEFGLGGQISIKVVQHRDTKGNPIPLDLEDVFGPPQKKGETGNAHQRRIEKYLTKRFNIETDASDDEKTKLAQDELGMPVMIHHVPLTPVKEAIKRSEG